jgi:hypothetical protein
MSSDFYANLNQAEIEYSARKELLSESPLTGDSLLSKLAQGVAELSGNPMNPAVMTLVITSAVESFKKMNLGFLVREAGKVL